jgi:type I restriction-modification system DNA methylase subunit
MIETAYEGKGKVGVVVPHGVLFRGSSEGKIRQKLIEENMLEAVIGLPANLFFGTGIPAAILIFNKGKGENRNVLFIDASQHFEPGKNQNKLREADLDRIVATYRVFADGSYEEMEEGEWRMEEGKWDNGEVDNGEWKKGKWRIVRPRTHFQLSILHFQLTNTLMSPHLKKSRKTSLTSTFLAM